MNEPLPQLVSIGRRGLSRGLAARKLTAQSFPSLARASAAGIPRSARVIVLQLDSFGRTPIQKGIRQLRRDMPVTDVLVWALEPDAVQVRDAFRGGAKDVVIGDGTRLLDRLEEVLEDQQLQPKLLRLDKNRRRKTRFDRMLSRSDAMWDIFDLIVRIAPTDASVLILGETGTGKELLARSIHRRSDRKGSLVTLNCGAVPESLIDSQLFGHEKGAFTGATSSREGLFRKADGGTLFLDEIGNIPLSAQYRLLRVLQEGRVLPVGGEEEIEVDVRLIAATNAALAEEVEQGRFREDLFYRLDVMRVDIPPLRDRPEDIVFLFGHFLSTFARSYSVARPQVSEGFLDALLEFPWPGNVRQLENVTEKLTITHAGERVSRKDFDGLVNVIADGDESKSGSEEAPTTTHPMLESALRSPLDEAAAAFERVYLVEHLRNNRGRIEQTANEIGVSRRTLLRKLTRHGLDKKQFR